PTNAIQSAVYFFGSGNSINSNALFPFNGTPITFGESNFSLDVTQTLVTIMTSGVYEVTYQVQGVMGGSEIPTINLVLNNNSVPQSVAIGVFTGIGTRTTISNTMLVEVTSPNSTLAIINNSGTILSDTYSYLTLTQLG
ncbi:hypothetical protein WAG23_15785, partial [Bacillus cereus]